MELECIYAAYMWVNPKKQWFLFKTSVNKDIKIQPKETQAKQKHTNTQAPPSHMKSQAYGGKGMKTAGETALPSSSP